MDASGARLAGSRPDAILKALVSHGVDFVVIGGLAAIAHGSRRMTRDIDVVVAPESANLARLGAALTELGTAKLVQRGAEQPIEDADLASIGLGATLHTRCPAGRLDVVGAPAGAAQFGDLLTRSLVSQIGGVEIRVAGLDDLIAMKRAAGRPLDLQDIADLTARDSDED